MESQVDGGGAEKDQLRALVREASLGASGPDTDNLRIMAATWNLHGKCPSASDLDRLFFRSRVHHDIYVLGTQEAVRPIAQSMVMPSKEEFNQTIMEYFNSSAGRVDQEEYMLVNSISLAATHLIVVCKKSLASYLTDIENGERAIGVGAMLANKGAVSISFKLGATRLLFISCHLAPHDDSLVRRNEQWEELNQRFVHKAGEERLLRKVACFPKKSDLGSRSSNSGPSTLQHFDSVIWMGDFNYRISTTQGNVVNMMIENDLYDQMVANDQLSLERQIKRVAFGYSEGALTFAPSYKVLVNTDTYDEKRSPAWTDRILYRSNDQILQLVNYDSNNTLKISDHRPVFAQFLLRFDQHGTPNQAVLKQKRIRALVQQSKPPRKPKANSIVPFNEDEIVRIQTSRVEDSDVLNNGDEADNEASRTQQHEELSMMIRDLQESEVNFGSTKTRACCIF